MELTQEQNLINGREALKRGRCDFEPLLLWREGGNTSITSGGAFIVMKLRIVQAIPILLEKIVAHTFPLPKLE